MELGTAVTRGSPGRTFGPAFLALGALAALAWWGIGPFRKPAAFLASDSCAKYEGLMAANCRRCGGDASGVYTCDRASMPTVATEAQYEVFYAESALTGSDLAGALGLYHSGITVVRKDGSAKERMTLQFYALDGFVPAVMPEFEQSGPVWKNDAKVAFMDDIDDAYWQRQILLTKVDGVVLNEYFDFVVGYAESHPAYQLFAVQHVSGESGNYEFSNMLVKDRTCDLFTRDSVFNLQSSGAIIIPEKIRYDTMRVYASVAKHMDIEHKGTTDEEIKFYKSLGQLMSKVQSATQSIQGDSRREKMAKALEIARQGFATFKDGTVFIGSPATGIYKTEVHAPYFAFGSLWIDTKTHVATDQPEIG